jgi:hypothetical protein
MPIFLSTFSLESVKTFLNEFEFSEIDPMIYGGLALVLLLILIVLKLACQKNHILAFEDESGKIEISPLALEELIISACNQVSTISRPKIKFAQNRNGLRISIRLRMAKDGNLNEIRNSLKNQLESSLRNNFCLNNFQGVDILIERFTSSSIDAETKRDDSETEDHS